MDAVTYTVAQLTRAIGQAVTRALPGEIWVQGEIRDLSRASSGHVYFALLDTEDGGGPPDVLPVTLFESDKVTVNRVLSRSGAVRMTDGVEVRIRGKVSYYGARGTIQLRMTWIDTDFTLGKLAAERDRLVKSLSKRGLLDRNPALPLPLVPLRVGLVTSVGSAAHADFMDELARSGFAWRIGVFDARVQGVDAESDVTRGLAALSRSGVDIIAVVRGGGAQTDLAVFDSEAIAVAIANCEVPVLTGIGHEIDVSVADLVARSFKTPTACAAALVALVNEFAGKVDQLAAGTRRAVRSRLALEASNLGHTARRVERSAVAAGARADQHLADAGARIARGSGSRIIRDGVGLDRLHERIGRASSRQVLMARHELGRVTGSIGIAGRRSIAQAGQRLTGFEHRLSLLDPASLFARGWSITRTDDGALVLDPEMVSAGTGLLTTVSGGTIRSVVSVDDEEVGRD